MSAKITLLLALAAVAVSTVMAQGSYGSYNPYHHLGGYGYGYGYNDEEGPINYNVDSASISTGSQEASNVYSKSSSNKNVGYNVNQKLDYVKEQTAQDANLPLEPDYY